MSGPHTLFAKLARAIRRLRGIDPGWQPPRVDLTPDGFEIVTDDARHRARWEDVRRIVAYKIDVFTMDRICLRFDTHEFSYTVDENMEGWTEFLHRLDEVFAPLSHDQWLRKVMVPPFATSEHVLFDRSAREQALVPKS
ncbi:MAG TPA: hypothetical protein VGR62_25380 [Candidatus Binatia bacterium]|jgi:hypothetical protein|nr:hypothetical protein [Candidatus Binatia bacterium]